MARIRVLSGLFALTLGLAAWVPSGRTASPGEDLYQQFREPPRQFGLMPYWFWNGNISSDETERQMRLMIDQGVYSAILFPWDGMEIPHLSEAWWQALGSALETARKLGFRLNLNDELTYPMQHLIFREDQRLRVRHVETGHHRLLTLKVLLATEIVRCRMLVNLMAGVY